MRLDDAVLDDAVLADVLPGASEFLVGTARVLAVLAVGRFVDARVGRMALNVAPSARTSVTMAAIWRRLCTRTA